MTITRLARAAGVASATALLVLTAACGSSTSGGSADSGSSDSGSGKSGSGDTSAASLTKADIFSKVVAAQKEQGSYTFTLNTSIAGQSISGTGEVDASGSTPSASATTTLQGQKVQTISTGGFFYLKAPFLGTDKWVKVDPKDKKGLGSAFGSSGDPAQALQALQGAAKVTKKGSAQVEGVDTTQYDVVVDSAAMLKSNPNLAQLKSLLPKTVTYSVFVDKDNLLRKFDNKIEVRGQQVETEIEFADYGKDVTVTAPPASQTTTDFKLPGAPTAG